MNSQTQSVAKPDTAGDALEAKQPHIENGTGVYSPAPYHRSDSMQLEWERLWPKAWLIAGVVSDLPENGSYFVFDIGRESVLVTRSTDGIHAFYNVCSHRGTRLVAEPHGKKSRFVCPFHSWCFTNQGRLQSITDSETFRPEVLAQTRGLTPIRCEEYAGLVFINMDNGAPPLRERIGLPEGYLERYGIGRMKVVRHVITEWEANWKIGVEAFYESYHLHAVHPETRFVMADLGVQYDLYPHGASRMIVPLGQMSPRMRDQHEMNEGLAGMLAEAGIDAEAYDGDATGVRRAIQQAKRARYKNEYGAFSDGQLTDSWATGIFPNVQIGCHPEGVFLMRFLPHPTNPERFYYNTMTMIRIRDDGQPVPAWMGLPEGTDTSGRIRPPIERFGVGEDGNLGQVLSQDAALMPRVQMGVRSRGFRGQIWGEQEQRLRHFHAELQRYIKGNK